MWCSDNPFVGPFLPEEKSDEETNTTSLMWRSDKPFVGPFLLKEKIDPANKYNIINVM